MANHIDALFSIQSFIFDYFADKRLSSKLAEFEWGKVLCDLLRRQPAGEGEAPSANARFKGRWLLRLQRPPLIAWPHIASVTAWASNAPNRRARHSAAHHPLAKSRNEMCAPISQKV
ncbi:hypothetical protein P4608_26750 [Ensifer adhaerens]|nr:hypothetical protein [Ensifer adhaerens]MDF8357664.1 hypothetical protein [Ensifer adhaerens]